MSSTAATLDPVVAHAGERISIPAPRAEWQAVLASDPNALVSQTPSWVDFMCAFGGYRDASRFYELAGGRRLVVPMVSRRLPARIGIEGSFPPSFGMGGIVAPGGVTRADVAAVFADLAARPSLRISLRPNPLDAEAWKSACPRGAVAVPRLAHVLPLDGGFEAVWNDRFTGTARTAVRKAERSGLEVERDTTGRLVPVLYELFERSLERWALQQHEPRVLALWRGRRRDPVRKFELMAKTLGDACRISVAWKDGRAVAAILVLQGPNAHYTRGMMDKELAGPTRANYLLHKLAIEDACAVGCRHYHMGETGTAGSLAQFKTRFGARPHPYAEYHLERLPITALDRQARGIVKRIVGFKDRS
jgi:hypothetical protein